MRGYLKKRWAGSWWRREDGTATIEFALLFPALMFIFLSSVELGVFLMRAALLDRALDINVRALRLGTLSPMTAEELKRRVCADSILLSDCQQAITIELVPVSKDDWEFPDAGIACVNRDEDINPVLEFTPGGQNEIMLVRACVIVDPFFPTTSLVMQMPVDASGGYSIATASVFVNEP